MSSYERPADISAATQSEPIEFRASEDDAWYGVRLLLEEETLRVKYCDFPKDAFDLRFRTSDLKDSKAMDNFKERFRPASVQLQDCDCRKVIEGKTVCASHAYGENDLKFYDAVIEAVCSSEHALENGSELCKCTFVVFWQHGPCAGTKTSTGIENICLLQSGSVQIDPALDSFLELSRKKLDKDEIGISAPKGGATCCIETHGPNVKNESDQPYKSLACYSKEVRSPKQPDSTMQTSKGRSSNGLKKIGQDTDLGGASFRTKDLEATFSYHFILIENLEKELTQSAIVDFMYQQTSILCQAFVSPSLLSEAYTRGAVFIENQEKLERLSRFLHSPTHLIMSSRGRPWIMPEKSWRLGTFGGMVPKSEKKLQNKNELADKIKVVQKGTEEYENGKRLRDLFLEFSEHQQRLHRRLASEERKLMQSNNTT